MTPARGAVAAMAAVGIAGLVGLAGCAGPRPTAGEAATAPAARFGTVLVTDADAGKQIIAARGERIEIRLANAPGRGFTVRLGSVVAPVLTADGPVRYVDDTEQQSRDGATNYEIWRFRAAEVGETTLRFDYRRAWEGTGPASVSVVYPVRVR